MKKLFLSVAIALGALTVNAQDMWVGGTAGIWSNNATGQKSQLNFKVMPEFGFVLNENFGAGITIGGSHESLNNLMDDVDYDDYASDEYINSFIINPFLRYTFLKGNLGGFFLDGGVSYAWGKTTNVKESDFWGLEVGIKPGVALNVSSKVSLIGKFGFLGYQHFDLGEKNKHDNFGLNFDLNNIEIGASIKF